MFGFIAGIPPQTEISFFKVQTFFTKPQYENFCRNELGFMVAGKSEHNIKSINEQFIYRKDQSSLNRFMTDAKWDVKDIASQAKNLYLPGKL